MPLLTLIFWHRSKMTTHLLTKQKKKHKNARDQMEQKNGPKNEINYSWRQISLCEPRHIDFTHK